MSGKTGSLAERKANVPPGTLERLNELRKQHPGWRQGEGFIGNPDSAKYFAVVLNDRSLERLHFTLARA